MTVPTETIDRIVANVLSQLGTPASDARRGTPPVLPDPPLLHVPERVVTAEVLEAAASGATLTILRTAIVTPAARDVARAKSLRLIRPSATDEKGQPASPASAPSSIHLYIVRHSEPLERVLDEQFTSNRRELLGSPDDAARLAISELCRGEATTAFIFAEQIHRAACLANRNEKVQAAAVRDVGDVKSARGQLRANVWCLDPTNRSYFELRNLFREINRR